MNIEKVVFAFFILSALTLNFGFFVGDIGDPAHHHPYELFAALVVSLIATILKFGDRSQLGAVLLAASLVADLQLIAAAAIWAYADNISRDRRGQCCNFEHRLTVRRRPDREYRVGDIADIRNHPVSALIRIHRPARDL